MTLRTELIAHLQGQLGDAETAQALAEIIEAETLTWCAPVIDVDRVTSVIAFTFGNRMLPNGNREPGPVNLALADIVAAVHQRSGARVFAQWEVAAELHGRVPATLVAAINPGRDARGEPVYLSTTGVVEAVVQQAGDAASLGRVGVVAFADHLYRCVAACRQLGLDAHAPEGVAMPAQYDPESGQAWCRSRIAYLLHDIMIRITERRSAVVGSRWQ